MAKIKQAVILCAGLGTRLRPLTDTMPKPMVPILGKPLLERNIEQFKKYGVTEFFINLYYLPDVIRNYFGDGAKWGVKINYFQEKEALGTAGGVKDFEGMLDDAFYVIYGDMFSCVDYSKMAEEFAKHSNVIGMQKMQRTDDYEGADVAELAADGSYSKIHPKPHAEHYPNAYRMKGVFILKKEILDYIPANTYYELGKQLLPDVVSRGKKFYSYESEEYTKCIENVDTYNKVEEYIKQGVGSSNKQKISACLVVYNEEKIIERCILSIKDLVDEIIVVHDGECKDKTLEIAREYTDKIFVREHIGEAEPHRAFSFTQTTGDWILQMDGDEYLDTADHARIRDMVENPPANVDGYIFKWEMWNEKNPIYFKGLQKMCLFRKKNFFYEAIPHEIGHVKGEAKKVDIFLHHRPLYNNMSWKSFLRKRAKWVPVHARYFFPEITKIEYFNTTEENWVKRTKKIRSHIAYYIVFEPIKMLLGQMKNGLWTSWNGINAGLQQFVYYFTLYLNVWKIQREKRHG